MNPANFDCDHIIPIRLGGPTCVSNIHLLCVACHRAKSGRERSRVCYPSTGDNGEGDAPRITPKEIPAIVASVEGVAHITGDGILGGDYMLEYGPHTPPRRYGKRVAKNSTLTVGCDVKARGSQFFFVFCGVKDVEKERMAGIDVMSFSSNDEKRLLALKENGIATPSDIAALKKFSVQQHFRQELSVNEIFTVLRSGRAVLNACSMLKLSAEERAVFFTAGAGMFGQSDYLALREIDQLLRVLGYSGLNDRTKSVNLLALDDAVDQAHQKTDGAEDVVESAEELGDLQVAEAEETYREAKDVTAIDLAEDVAETRKLAANVKKKLEEVKKILRRVRIRGTKDRMLTEMKGILKNLIGIRFEGERGPRPERVVVHKMQECKDIWRIARIPNDFFDEKWKVAVLEKGRKRKRRG